MGMVTPLQAALLNDNTSLPLPDGPSAKACYAYENAQALEKVYHIRVTQSIVMSIGVCKI